MGIEVPIKFSGLRLNSSAFFLPSSCIVRMQVVRVTRVFKGNRSANRKLLNNKGILERTELRTSQICELHNDT
jgi:hypothetical protein